MASDESAQTSVSQGSTSQPSCPAFLSKLWLLVEDEGTNDYIHWSEEGNSFIVQDQVIFAHVLLPQFFKHNNMASFIRQLNMYGFRKKTHLDEGALKTERTDIEFQHPHFLKGEIRQLEQIKRKVSSKEDSKTKGNDITRILSDVRDVKGKQDNISAKLESIKSENTALWREVVTLRQRHEKQQKIVNRLIHFLITLVQPKVTGTKRRQGNQLMIQGFNDGPSPSKAKYARTLPGTAIIDELPVNLTSQKESNLDFLKVGPGGDAPSFADFEGIPAAQSKVKELIARGELQTASSMPATSATNLPTAAHTEPRIDSVLTSDASGLLSEDDLVADMPGDATSLLADAPSSSMDPAPATVQDIPVLQALSPDVTFPMTPAVESSWDAGSPPAEVFGLEEAGVIGDTDAPSAGLTFEDDMSDLGDGQMLVMSKSSVDMGDLPLSTGAPSSRAMVQRMLSHDEQKPGYSGMGFAERSDIGEQLNTVQSNLQEFQQMISSNPSFTMELGGLLNDFQELFDDGVPLTIPDMMTNPANVETGQEENGGESSGLLRRASEMPSMGNELVTYKPSSSSLSLSSFMAEDEDSLLRSLDDDSDSLRQQQEREGGVRFEI